MCGVTEIFLTAPDRVAASLISNCKYQTILFPLFRHGETQEDQQLTQVKCVIGFHVCFSPEVTLDHTMCEIPSRFYRYYSVCLQVKRKSS